MNFFLSYVAVYAVVLPLIAGIFYFNKLLSASKALFCFLLISGGSDVVNGIMIMRRVDTTSLLHIYTVVEFLIISLFFYRAFNFKSKGKLIITVDLLFIILSAINTAFFQPLHILNTYTRSLEGLIILIFCFLYFDQESKTRQSIRWEKKSLNWMVTGLLIYFAGAFFFFLFMNAISVLPIPTQLIIWVLHGVFQVIMYVLITVGYLNERSK